MTGRRIGFTTRASCLLAAGLTAMLCGVVLGETDLVRAGVLAAAVPLAAAVVVHRSRVRVANRRSVEPQQTSAGQAVTVHLTITNRSALPSGALLLEDQLPDRFTGRARFVLDSLRSNESRTVSYRLPALSRGRYRAGPLQVRLSDPFGMIDLTRAFTATTEFLVTPVIDLLPASEPPRSDELGDGASSHSIGSHGADDASTREYRTGDDLRKIHWRSSARTGALMVRQEERPWRSQTTVVLDVRAVAHAARPAGSPGPGVDDTVAADPRLADSFEWAVSAAASIAAQAMRQGRDIGLIADPTRAEIVRFAGPSHLSTHLASVQPVHTPELTAVSDLLRASARDSALVAVLGRLDPRTLRLLADAHPRGKSSPALALLLDVDSWTDSGTAAADPRRGRPADPGMPGADAAAAVLRGAGWRVVVVRHGMGIAQAWQLLLANVPTQAPLGAR
jgi:uncharacterized protein (DUF58 family)